MSNNKPRPSRLVDIHLVDGFIHEYRETQDDRGNWVIKRHSTSVAETIAEAKRRAGVTDDE